MILAHLFHFKPFVCPGCTEASRDMICESCLISMKKNHRMLAPSEDGIRGIFPVFIAYTTTHFILTHWKDQGGEELRKLLFSPSPDLKIELLKMNFDAVVPIPQNKIRSLKRGHESAFEVAKFFTKELKVPLISALELKNISTPKQADLDQWERKYGESPFVCDPLLVSGMRRILIVDDFITTGSTLEKAANAILQKNPRANIYAASLGWKPRVKN